MNSTDKLKTLAELCKCDLSVYINPHRSDYKTIRDFLQFELEEGHVDESGVLLMEKADTLVNVHVYPDTPIGFYSIYRHDLDLALDVAIECIIKERKN